MKINSTTGLDPIVLSLLPSHPSDPKSHVQDRTAVSVLHSACRLKSSANLQGQKAATTKLCVVQSLVGCSPAFLAPPHEAPTKSRGSPAVSKRLTPLRKVCQGEEQVAFLQLDCAIAHARPTGVNWEAQQSKSPVQWATLVMAMRCGALVG